MTIIDAIKALKRARNSDGGLELDKAQADYLEFLLWSIADGDPVKYAVMDLVGAIAPAINPSESECAGEREGA